jgi:hypothetical protein
MALITSKGAIMKLVKAHFYGGAMDGQVEVVEKSKLLEVGAPATGQAHRYRLHLDTIPLGSEPGFAIFVPEAMSAQEAASLVRERLPNRTARS